MVSVCPSWVFEAVILSCITQCLSVWAAVCDSDKLSEINKAPASQTMSDTHSRTHAHSHTNSCTRTLTCAFTHTHAYLILKMKYINFT